MARWTKDSLVKLGGTDRNIVIDEILKGEDNIWDIIFTIDSHITVTKYSDNKILVSDAELLNVGDYISFCDTNTVHQIIQIDDRIITLDHMPNTVHGVLKFPVDLTGATFEFKLTPRIAVIEDGRNGLDITSISSVDPTKTFDGTVITTIPTFSLTNGQIRLSLTNEQIDPVTNPVEELDTNSTRLLTGYYSVTFPSEDGITPVQTKKQRICFVLRTDGVSV